MERHYSTLHRALEVTGITGFLSLVVYGVVQVEGAVSDMAGGFGARIGLWLGGGLIGYIVGDFASGFVHWMGDRYGSEQTPVLGPNFVKPFREHHVSPRAICAHDFVEVNGNNCLVSIPILALTIFLMPVSAWVWLFAKATLLVLCMTGFLTNQFHKWSHDPAPGLLVRSLQRLHLILPPAHHDVHHTPPHDGYYCITTGWLNRPLAAIGFWSRLERLVERVLGARVSA